MRGWLAAMLVLSALLWAPVASAGGGAGGGAADTLVVNFAGDVAYPDRWPRVAEVDRRKAKLFEQVQPILDSGDLNFANLECPITSARHRAKAAGAGKKWAITCAPARLAYVLDSGLNLLSLANNHTADAGFRGLTDTLAALGQARAAGRELWWAGLGRDGAAALRPASLESKGVRVAFLAGSGHVVPAQIASLRDRRFIDAVRRAAANHDLVIVSSHSGGEYMHVPQPRVARDHRALIDAGADVVVGHHAHVVQGVEKYGGGVIFHGLGNFSFASLTERHMRAGVRMLGMLVRVTFRNATPESVELIPLYVDNRMGWMVGAQLLRARFATPQLLAGPFADEALASFERFAATVPDAGPTRLTKIGARAFVDLGRPIRESERRRSLEMQRREYAAVIRSGAAPAHAR